MSRKVEAGYQMRLKDADKIEANPPFFPEGTIVYPEYFGRGALENPVHVIRIEERIRKLSGWRALDEMQLYFDNRHRSLPPGTRFGAFAENLKREKKSKTKS